MFAKNNVHLLTCVNCDHQSAVLLQKAVRETDGIGKIVQIVDHLLENIGMMFLVSVDINENHQFQF